MNEREASIELRICEGAKRRGWLALKVKFVDSGYPDRLFISKLGLHVYMEVKRPGKVPEPHQCNRMHELRKRGILVTWTDNSDDGLYFLKQWETVHPSRLSETRDPESNLPRRSGPVHGSGVGKDSLNPQRLYGPSQEGLGEKDVGDRTT